MRARWVVALVFVGLLGADLLRVQPRAARVRARGRRRLLHLDRAGAAGRVARVHDATSSKEAEKILLAVPEVESVFSILGFSFTGSALEPGAHLHAAQAVRRAASGRSSAIQALLPRLRGPLFGIQGGLVIPFAPPGINIGNFGGFTFEVLDQGGAADIQSLGNAVQALVGASQQSTQVAGLFSSFTANDPQLAVDIDREKARSLGLPISEITNAMQIYLGSCVRERLRLQQPRVPRLRAGGQGVSVGPAGPRPVLRADDERARWCRWPTWCACARRRRRR